MIGCTSNIINKVMIKITKDKLYKLDRLRQGVPNQEYLVDGKDIYIGNPYGNITFLKNSSDTSNITKEEVAKLINSNAIGLLGSTEKPLTFIAPLTRTLNTISITQADASTDGYLSSTDWSTFNNKENVLTFNNGLTRTGNTVSIDYAKTGNVYTGNGLVSSSLFKFNGSLYTGGSSTTTKPFMLFEPNGTTSTNWSTEGTWIGINTATGFIGNFLHGLLNNTEKFKFDYTGKLTITSADANINGLTIGKGNGYYANNTAIGIDVLVKRTSGTANTGIGWRALYELTQGEGNNGFGIWALRDNLTGSYNSGLGYTTLAQNTTGTGNSAIGRNALGKNLDGNYNTGIGYQAGGTNTAGTISGTHRNTFIGAFTAENIGVGASDNIVIGYDIDLPSSTGTYQLVIGNLIYGTNISGSGTTVSSGGIGIGVAAVNASARLQIDSTSKGLLVPRWTTAQRTAISSPATSLLGYDTDLNSFYYYNGGWNTLGGGGVYTASNGVTLVTADFQIDYTRTGNIYTGNGLVSSPLMWYNGAVYTGGSSTTTKPLILIEPSGTTSNNWDTSGTMFGINAASGFGGYLAHYQIASSSKFYVTSTDFSIGSGAARLSTYGAGNRIDITAAQILAQYSHTYFGGGGGSWSFANNLAVGDTVASTGARLDIVGASLTGSQTNSALNITQTWNTTGVVKAILVNITNTASDATSKLQDLQVGSVSKFNIGLLGNITNTGNNIASTSLLLSNGTWYTGGSATTTKPSWLLEPTGTTSTDWSTDGTGIGINAASGFIGNLIDAKTNNTSKFKVDYSGIITEATWRGNSIVANNYPLYAALGGSIVAETVPMNQLVTEGGLINQNLYLTAIYISKTTTITGVKWYQPLQGNYTSMDYNGFGFYSYSGGTLTLVASTTNDGNIWKGASNTWQSKAFSSSYIAAPGVYYIANLFCRNGAATTVPTMANTNFRNSQYSIMDFTNSAFLSGELGSQTSLPATITISTAARTQALKYIALY